MSRQERQTPTVPMRRLAGAALVILPALMALGFAGSATAATILVSTEADGLISDGLCSLREAISASNQSAAIDTCGAGELAVIDVIQVPEGSYGLNLVSGDDDVNQVGDLDITESVHIIGLAAGFEITAAATSTLRSYATLVDVLGEADATLENVTVRGGGSGLSAAVVVVGSASLTLRGCRLLDGVNGFGDGGCILAHSHVLVSDSVIQGCSASRGGGAAFLGGVTMERCLVTGNQAWGDRGGGLYVGGFQSWIIDSVISGNSCSLGSGGGVYTGSGYLWVQRSTLFSNEAYSGSALHGGNGQILMENSTVTGNISRNAAAILLTSTAGTSIFENSTIAFNHGSPTGDGGGILVVDQEVTLEQSIVAFNSPASCLAGGSTPGSSGSIVSMGDNIDSGSSCGFGAGDLSNTDPRLGVLVLHGGLTPVLLPCEGSPAIDLGVSLVDRFPALPVDDQRGVTRPQDGDKDGSALRDAGAVEVVSGEAPIFADGLERGDATGWASSR